MSRNVLWTFLYHPWKYFHNLEMLWNALKNIQRLEIVNSFKIIIAVLYEIFLGRYIFGPNLTNQQCLLKMYNFMFSCGWGGECVICLKDNFPAKPHMVVLVVLVP